MTAIEARRRKARRFTLIMVAVMIASYFGVIFGVGYVAGADVPGSYAPAIQTYLMATSAITILFVGPLSFAIGRITKEYN